jgi:SAM-dependent MidA family methyltransferase
MTVKIDYITISGADRAGVVEAEIDFNDAAEVIKEFGVKECLDAIDSSDFLNEIGWEEAKKYFSDEIQEERDEAVKEAANV